MLHMFEVHQSRPTVREVGIPDSSLPMREEGRMETTIKSEEETKAGNQRRPRTAKAKGSPSGQGNKRDPNLDHEAVKLYRETFRLCPNFGYRNDIVVTVTNLDRWKTILGRWKRNKWNPMKVGWLLSEYERTDGTNGASSRTVGRATQHRS